MPKQSRTTTSFENIFVSETHRIIYEEISYLKKRIHLVEGERKANYESNEETLKKNDVLITVLREKNQEVKKKKKIMLDSRDTFFKQIATKLGGEKKAYEFKEKKFSEAVDILECKIGTFRNKMNYLKYTKEQQDKQMISVLEEEERLKSILDGKVSQEITNTQRRFEDIKIIETSTAAMQMKITEADNIRCRYKNMASLLKSENFSLNIKVTEQDKKLDSEKAEIERIQYKLQDSVKAKKLAKSRLTEIEESTIKEYSEREQQLYEARMKLKQIREKMEQIGSKLSFPKFHMIHRDSSVAEGLYVGYQTSIDKRESKTQTLIETVYSQLANMIGETDPAIIVTRFEEQRVHSKELLAQEGVAKSSVRKSKLRKRFLVDKLSQLQYSGGLRREKLNVKSGKINLEMSTTSFEREKLDKWLQDHFSVMEQMQTKLIEICQNNELKTPVLTSDIPAEKVQTLLKYVLKQLEKLLGAQEGSMFSPILLSPYTMEAGEERAETKNIIPFEINAEGSPFGLGLPSPVGSNASFRFGGSISDFEMSSMTPIVMNGAGEKLPFEDNDFRDREPSIVVPEGPSLIKSSMDDGIKREDSAGIKNKSSLRRGESSEEEEAVSRNFVKRQSQILYEAKTRKGRFNSGMAANVRSRKY